MSDASPTTSMEQIAEDAGFSLWQERAPQGPWFLETPHDGHVFFGGDVVSAQQAHDAIARLCMEIVNLRSQLVSVNRHCDVQAETIRALNTQLVSAKGALLTARGALDNPASPALRAYAFRAINVALTALTDDQGTTDV